MAFGANFTALYVQTAEPAEKTPEDQARLQKHIRLAEQSCRGGDASEIFDITATKLVKLLGRDLTAAPAGRTGEQNCPRNTLQRADRRKDGKIFDPREQEIIQWVLDSQKRGENIWIAVEDNGPGIPKESREHVFEMFYSGKNKVSDSRRSLGLGLALCRSIVNAHGGEIALYDCDPQGCCFWFNLPLSEVNLNE